MYKRVATSGNIREMMQSSGFFSLNFSGNMGVIKTRPGYASSIAYNIDNSDIPEIMGTIAGDDTIFIVVKEGADKNNIIEGLNGIIPNI
jgi:transcriptional regulator of arginine metabolism